MLFFVMNHRFGLMTSMKHQFFFDVMGKVLLIKVLQIRVLLIKVLLSSGSFCSLPCRLCLLSATDALRSLGSCNWDDLLHVQSYAYTF